MVKIYLDAGHGGSDPGASGHGIKEKDITLKIAKKVRQYLKDYKNVSVKMSRTGDSYPTLSQRTNEANAWGADAFVSIHINSGGGVGYEDFIYNGNVSTKTQTLQNEVHNQVSKHFDTNRGKKRANLHVCRESKMPAVLTENGFIDNSNDAANMKDDSFLDKVAKAHAEGVAKAFNLTKDSNTSQNNKKPSKPTTSDYTGNSVVDYLKSIGQDSGFANRKKLATKHGISNYKGTAKQNVDLLNKLQKGKPTASTITKAKGITSYIQDTVNKRYGLRIAVDNLKGPETYKALLKGYQTELNKQFNAGLKVDGLWGPKTDQAGVTVRPGAKGNLTWVLQAILYVKGYTVVGKPDKIFGDNTGKAVRACQKATNQKVDGIPGRNTFRALFS